MPPGPIPGDTKTSGELTKVAQDGGGGARFPKASTMLLQPKQSSLHP